MITRRNSTIEFVRIENKDAVLKKYHATYNIQKEFQKILELSRILDYSSRFRCVEVIKVHGDELILEKIDGYSFESLNNFQITCLIKHNKEIISLFLMCDSLGFSFDSDLSNLFYSNLISEFIFIDPVQEDLEIDHLSFVVFALGIIKSLGKSKNIFQLGKKIYCFNNFFRQYSITGNIDPSVLKQSFYKYIDVIIQWNILAPSKNKSGIKFLRLFILIPIWKLIKLYIKKLKIYERS